MVSCRSPSLSEISRNGNRLSDLMMAMALVVLPSTLIPSMLAMQRSPDLMLGCFVWSNRCLAILREYVRNLSGWSKMVDAKLNISFSSMFDEW